jgi:trigger factor
MTISSTHLQINIQEQERWRRTVSVTVPAGVVKQERAVVVKHLASRLKLPGFRKGKVPTSVVENQYGPELQKETLDKVIQEAYRAALAEHSLQPISEGEVENVDYVPEEDLTFRISFDVRPKIEVPRLSGFKVERPRVQVGEAEEDKVLDRLRDRSAVWRPVQDDGPAQEGDTVTVQLTPLGEGDLPEGEPQGYQMVVGEGDAIPDVEAAILRLAVGAAGDFTVRFPMDFADEAKRGEEQRLRISVLDRRVKELPPLDDEFARSVGDFDNVDALRARIRTDIEEEASADAEETVNKQLLNTLVEANPFDVPRSMVDRYVESLLGDTSKAEPEVVARAREQILPEAERGVKRILVIDHVAEVRDIHATEDEVGRRVAELAEMGGTTPAQARAQLQKAGRLEGLEREITERKVIEFLREQSEIIDEM